MAYSIDPGHVITERMKLTTQDKGFEEHFIGTPPEVVGAAVDTRVGGKAIKNFDDWVDVRKAIDRWAELLAIRLCLQRGEAPEACRAR